MGPGCGPLGPIGNRGLGPNPGPWSGEGPIPGRGPCMKGSGPLGGNGGRIPGRIMSGGGGPLSKKKKTATTINYVSQLGEPRSLTSPSQHFL